MMKRSSDFILTSIFILSLCECNKSGVTATNFINNCQRADSFKTDSIREESNYRMVDKVEHFYVKYSNDINDYSVTLECIKNTPLNDGTWRANIYFKHKSGYLFTLIDSCYNAYALPESGVTFLSNDTTIIINYPASLNADTLRHDVPFFFSDVNYDEKKELIINVHGCGQRFRDMFQVFALDKSGNLLPHYKQITYQKPFVDFDSFTHFDKRNNSVTNNFSGGAGDGQNETFNINVRKSVSKYNRYALHHIDILENGVERVLFSKKDLLISETNYLHQMYYDTQLDNKK